MFNKKRIEELEDCVDITMKTILVLINKVERLESLVVPAPKKRVRKKGSKNKIK